ncbi:MAG: class I SAM-dependent methyltransferase [Phycisphaerae bacterium]
MSSDSPPPPPTATQRTRCNLCGRDFDERASEQADVRCNVRAFAAERFTIWRCAGCRCLHCRSVVDLDRYYAAYPVYQQRLDWFARLALGRLLARCRAAGLNRAHRLLDYGCGSGNFVRYLHSRGYAHAVGYDPYAAGPLGDPQVLAAGPFDFVCLLDVIEHVEDPRELLAHMARLVRPGGHLLLGTPAADKIDLRHADRHVNHLHVPYHLHIYTQAALESLGRAAGFEPCRAYHRYFAETPLFGMNELFWRGYQRRLDDTVDALGEPLRIGLILRSPVLLFQGTFGYLCRPRHSVTIVFRRG